MRMRDHGLLATALLVSAAMSAVPERPGDYPMGPKDLVEVRVL